MGRLLAVIGGIVWLSAMVVLVAMAVHWTEQPLHVPRQTSTPTLLRQLNAARAPSLKEGESWVVTKVTSAHHILVVNVDADRLENSQAIAAEIVAPVRDRKFDEILVYVRQMRSRKGYADRRVQWTPTGGYTELVIGD
jgi:hypothetical protein